jgi:hypothetical protein
MTREQFNAWYDDLKIRLPSLWTWAEGLPDTKASLNAWYELTFESLVYEDCMEVTRLIFVGDVDKPYGTDIPAVYGREARRMRFERRPKEVETAPASGVWDEVTKGSMAAAYRKACEIVREDGVAAMKGSRSVEWKGLM